MAFLGKTALLGTLMTFARSQKGRELAAKAKTVAMDPENQRKAKEFGRKITKKR
ncbi:hypothetical protein [Nakamurella antarctica]|uniref:hypothetical protein n=1 Tax=Nakamurella antarctica TaxID=1902245 RepID=UPI0013DE707A|nr:hypothetical protein [Nakamurella antarctica]